MSHGPNYLRLTLEISPGTKLSDRQLRCCWRILNATIGQLKSELDGSMEHDTEIKADRTIWQYPPKEVFDAIGIPQDIIGKTITIAIHENSLGIQAGLEFETMVKSCVITRRGNSFECKLDVDNKLIKDIRFGRLTWLNQTWVLLGRPEGLQYYSKSVFAHIAKIH